MHIFGYAQAKGQTHTNLHIKYMHMLAYSFHILLDKQRTRSYVNFFFIIPEHIKFCVFICWHFSRLQKSRWRRNVVLFEYEGIECR